jgi:hypothetical protein
MAAVLVLYCAKLFQYQEDTSQHSNYVVIIWQYVGYTSMHYSDSECVLLCLASRLQDLSLASHSCKSVETVAYLRVCVLFHNIFILTKSTDF